MTRMVNLQSMMDRQKLLQRALGGDKPPPPEREPSAQMEYIREMTLACENELHEALTETGWKTWATTDHINRDAFVAELVDAMQFLFNLFSVVDADAEEIAAKLKAKHEINWARHNSGKYAANGDGKCRHCKRALDDPAVKCTPQICYGIAS